MSSLKNGKKYSAGYNQVANEYYNKYATTQQPDRSTQTTYNGLQLSRYINDVATKISGPVSMYVLKPTEKAYKLPLSIPIIMLFGDRHDTRENECANCENDPRCYEIDNRLLAKLNELTSKKYPIDFYTETFGSHQIDKQDEKSRLYSFISIDHLISTCYGPNKKNTCPYPNIRFHFSDSRHANGYFEYTINHIHQIVSAIVNEKIKAEELERYNYVQSTIDELIELFEKNDKDTIKYAFFDYIINKPNSLIRKEFNRLEIVNDMNIWRYYFGKIYLQSEADMNMERILDGLKSIRFDQSTNVKTLSTILISLHIFMLRTIARVLDIYFLMRVFKTLQPKAGTNSNRSGVAIGYFGDVHTRNIVHFLVETELYTLVYGNPTDMNEEDSTNSNRCITIDQPVPLFGLLSQHMERLERNNNVQSRNKSPILPRNQVYVEPTEPNKPKWTRNQVYVEPTEPNKPKWTRNQVYVEPTEPNNQTQPINPNITSTISSGGHRKKNRHYTKKARRHVKKSRRQK
jgi:hypothetical protein